MARFQIYGDVLRGGVGRRVFLLFVGCSLFPVLFFAVFALIRVGQELEDQADRQMAKSAGAAALALRERLGFARDGLIDVGRVVAGTSAPDGLSCPLLGPVRYVFEPSRATSAAERFEGVLIRDVHGHEQMVPSCSRLLLWIPLQRIGCARGRLRSDRSTFRWRAAGSFSSCRSVTPDSRPRRSSPRLSSGRKGR
ncbi:MAG: hypothetical protein R3E97_20920 [Candidatus Eisenbacteria bacterium]